MRPRRSRRRVGAVVVRLVLILVVPDELQWYQAAPDQIPDPEEILAR